MTEIEGERHDNPPGDAGRLAALELLSGRVCLDFVNTVDPRVGDERQDYLTNYANLVRWSGHAHLLPEDQQAALLRAAGRHPREAAAVFARAVALRETLYRAFSASAVRLAPAAADLDAIRTAYIDTMAQAQLVPLADGFEWRWPAGSDALDQMLWPVIRSAVELLTAPELRRVKVCPGLGDCGWLFLDTSKSGRRRWCSMEGCGSRSKMRRYYARTHPPLRSMKPAQAEPLEVVGQRV
jgi:predicted RNA-binding Zn ribbon-like protein